MNRYAVWPLGTEDLHLYTTMGATLRPGILVEGDDPEDAAGAAKGHFTATRRFAVAEVTLIDYTVPEGRESMPTDEGPHR